MTLSSLLERVEKAEGPDRELDAALWQVLEPRSYQKALGPASGLRPKGSDLTAWAARWAPKAAKPYTASLDAALALVERVLPELCIMIASAAPSGWWARLREVPEPQPSWQATAPTPALALLAALLKALIAQSNNTSHSMEGEK